LQLKKLEPHCPKAGCISLIPHRAPAREEKREREEGEEKRREREEGEERGEEERKRGREEERKKIGRAHV
jgi:hypothetical protein